MSTNSVLKAFQALFKVIKTVLRKVRVRLIVRELESATKPSCQIFMKFGIKDVNKNLSSKSLVKIGAVTVALYYGVSKNLYP
jgi:hypothetical protein